MFRRIVNPNYMFREDITPRAYRWAEERIPVDNSGLLEQVLREQVAKALAGGKTALALSGGIDSAILARFMPAGSVAYTFRCVVPGFQVMDEVPAAAQYAEACGLEHRVVEITWEDMERYAPILMRHKGEPIHSIEVQIYKAALQAKKDGFEALIFGESADANFGGHDGLHAKDWETGAFMKRYAYLMPDEALRKGWRISEPFDRYAEDGRIDSHAFMCGEYFRESMASYENACAAAGIRFVAPYAHTTLKGTLDYQRVRNGESKYLIREIFRRLYPGMAIPAKIPMPRPTEEWFRDWKGPEREEFLPGCVDGRKGDQKWLLWALERFLNILDERD